MVATMQYLRLYCAKTAQGCPYGAYNLTRYIRNRLDLQSRLSDSKSCKTWFSDAAGTEFVSRLCRQGGCEHTTWPLAGGCTDCAVSSVVRRQQAMRISSELHRSVVALMMLLLAAKLPCKVTELSSSIILMGAKDYTMQGNRSECTDMVDRAAKQANSRLNFVPTLFWADRNHKKSKAASAVGLSYFCFESTASSDSTLSCRPAAQQEIDVFQHSMKACFARAVEYNMSIEVTPHLQYSKENTIPSNTLDFNPLLDYEDFSYMDVMLAPLANAVNGAINSKTEVWLALQGQTGASVFQHPMEYMQAAGTTHYNLYDNLPDDWPQHLHVGISLNFNKLCGCVLADVADPREYIERFPIEFKKIKHNYDFELLHELVHHLDFISISGLAALSPSFSPADLQTTIQSFAMELSEFGISLADSLSNQPLKLHWVDFGIGGARADGALAKTAADAACSSSFGVLGKYSQVSDPWQLHAITTTETPVRTFLSYFYNNTAEYFWKQHEFKYQVDAVFLNNFGSWDIQAVHPDSSAQEGSYLFERASHVIRYHNQRSQRLINLSKTLGEAGVKFLIESREQQHRSPMARVPQGQFGGWRIAS